MSKIIYVKYSNERAPQFALKTTIMDEAGTRVVRKSPAHPAAADHVTKLLRWKRELGNVFAGTKLVPCGCREAADGSVDFEFASGTSLEKLLDERLEAEDFQGLFELVREFVSICRQAATETFACTEAFQDVFGKLEIGGEWKAFPVSDVDMIFANVLVERDNWTLIDYEWCFDFPIPVDFVLYRAIHYYVYTRKSREVLVEKGIFDLLGDGAACVQEYVRMEEHFQSYIEGNMVAVRNMHGYMGQPYHDLVGMLVSGAPGYSLSMVEAYKNRGEGFLPCEKSEFHVAREGDEFLFEIPIEESVKMLRFDPAICGCQVDVLEMVGTWQESQESLLDVISHNGIRREENRFVFPDHDPWFWLDVPEGKEGVFRIRYRLTTLNEEETRLWTQIRQTEEDRDRMLAERQDVVEDLNRQVENLKNVLGEEQQKTLEERGQKESLEREVESLREQIARLSEELTAMTESMSWKVTKPLRAVKNTFVK